MAAKGRSFTFTTTGIFKKFGNLKKEQEEVNANDLNRTFSDPGSGYVPQSFTNSIQADLDNLVAESDDDVVFQIQHNITSTSRTGHQQQLENNLRLNRSHWKDKSKFNHCHRCAKPFGFSGRKFNCRRCGDVFCESCCQYRKRLNTDCLPDPQGNIHRVCYKCSDLHTQALGEVRSLTEYFLGHRQNKRMIISKELKRLITGFEQNVDPNSKFKTLAESLIGIKVPEWQKSDKWLVSQEVEWCTKCSSKFTIFNAKHHCRICGSVFCRYCCKNDFLLYYDEKQQSKACLINVVGCPDTEPSVCLYLPICVLCYSELEEYQVQQFHLMLNHVDGERGNLAKVGEILERLRHVERKLESYLPRFQDMVEAYVYEQQYENVAGTSNVNDYAKLQGDISDLFSKYAAIIQGLKQYDLTCATELKIMRNVTSVKCSLYNEQMNVFKKLKSTLNKSLPAAELERLQEYANTQAINNTYVTTRQLGFETLALSEKYSFDTSIAERLSEVDAICFEELKDYVESTGEDWSIHHNILNTLLKDQLKKKRLILPSKTLAARDGSGYVKTFVMQRSFTVLFQISTSLKAKSSDGRFHRTKEGLKKLLNDVNVHLKHYGDLKVYE